MRDTPMVDAMMKFCFGTDEEFVRIKDAAKLERELNSANAEVERLTNKVAQLYEGSEEQKQRIKRLEGELESTKADRDSWSNQSDEFAKTAADLIIRIQRLEEAGDALKASGYFGGFGDAVNKWIKVREAKP